MHAIMEKLRSNNIYEQHLIEKEKADITALLSLCSAFPPSYLEFMTRYGGGKFFREGLGYLLIVLQTPQKDEDYEHGVLFRFGSYDDDYCYFMLSSMKPNEESPVYAFVDAELTLVANSFAEWFTLAATQLLSQQQSNIAGKNVAMFTEKEKQILQSRKKYLWRVVRRNDRFVIVNIANNSDSTLNCITLGVRSHDRTLNGAVKVDVRDLAPGMSRNISLDCYSDLVHPSLVEIFDLPEPTPGTRSTYFELEDVEKTREKGVQKKEKHKEKGHSPKKVDGKSPPGGNET